MQRLPSDTGISNKSTANHRENLVFSAGSVCDFIVNEYAFAGVFEFKVFFFFQIKIFLDIFAYI